MSNKTQLMNGHNVGITLSHYEYLTNLFMDDGSGRIVLNRTIPVQGAGHWEDLVSKLKRFDVLRFMNWQKTNIKGETSKPPMNLNQLKWVNSESVLGQTRGVWYERTEAPPPQTIFLPPQPGIIDPDNIDSARVGAWRDFKGVPLKYCLKLAIECDANPWLCIPHGESESEYTQMMQYIVDETLSTLQETGLTPIFEFSNEVWNSGFGQRKECANQYSQSGNSHRGDNNNDSGNSLRWQILRTNELAEYAHTAAESMGLEVCVVLSSQAYNASITKYLLTHGPGDEWANLGLDVELSTHIDALAIAPYFGMPQHKNESDWKWEPDEIWRGRFHPFREYKKDGISILHPRDWESPNQSDIDAANQRLYQNLHDFLLLNEENESDLPENQRITGVVQRAFEVHKQLVNDFNTAHRSGSEPLRLWAYEGGFDLKAEPGRVSYIPYNLERINGIYAGFHSLPLAGELIDDLVKTWFEKAGDGLFCAYSSVTPYRRDKPDQPGEFERDFFGFIELRQEIENDTLLSMLCVATPKLTKLLEHAHKTNLVDVPIESPPVENHMLGMASSAEDSNRRDSISPVPDKLISRKEGRRSAKPISVESEISDSQIRLLQAGCRLRIWKQDPSDRAIGIRRLYVPGHVSSGPKDDEIEIVGIATVEPDDKGDFLLDKFQNPAQFDAVHTYGVTRLVLTTFKRALKQLDTSEYIERFESRWTRLKVSPHFSEEKNAFYNPSQHVINYGYFPPTRETEMEWMNLHMEALQKQPFSLGEDLPRFVYTCRSFDIVAHETGHAILHTLKPAYLDSPRGRVIHEAFGDLVAFFAMLAQLDMCEAFIVESKGNLRESNFLSRVAEQFGYQAFGREQGLRNLINSKKMSEMQQETSFHKVSQVLSGAVYDVVASIYETEIRIENENPALTLYKIGNEVLSYVLKAIIKAPDEEIKLSDIAYELISATREPRRRSQIRYVMDDRELLNEHELAITMAGLVDDEIESTADLHQEPTAV